MTRPKFRRPFLLKHRPVERATGKGQKPVTRGLTWPPEALASLSPRKFLSVRANLADRLRMELNWISLRVTDRSDHCGPRTPADTEGTEPRSRPWGSG